MIVQTHTQSNTIEILLLIVENKTSCQLFFCRSTYQIFLVAEYNSFFTLPTLTSNYNLAPKIITQALIIYLTSLILKLERGILPNCHIYPHARREERYETNQLCFS